MVKRNMVEAKPTEPANDPAPVAVPQKVPGPVASEFSATFSDPKLFAQVLKVLGTLIEETYIHFTPTGIKLFGIEAAHVAMASIWMPASLFSSYITAVEAKDLGVNVQDFVKILNRAKATVDDLIIETQGNVLVVKLKSDKSKRTFKLKSKEIQGLDSKEVDLLDNFKETLKDKFTASVTLDGEIFNEIRTDAGVVADLMRVEVSKINKSLTCMASSENGDVEVNLDLQGMGVLDCVVNGDAQGIYALNRIENMAPYAVMASRVTLRLGNNIPMHLQMPIKPAGAGDGPIGTFDYLVAPRVEEKGDDGDDTGEDLEGSDANDASEAEADDE